LRPVEKGGDDPHELLSRGHDELTERITLDEEWTLPMNQKVERENGSVVWTNALRSRKPWAILVSLTIAPMPSMPMLLVVASDGFDAAIAKIRLTRESQDGLLSKTGRTLELSTSDNQSVAQIEKLSSEAFKINDHIPCRDHRLR
jgi:hypothetical protein